MRSATVVIGSAFLAFVSAAWLPAAPAAGQAASVTTSPLPFKETLVTLKFEDAPANEVYTAPFKQVNAKMPRFPRGLGLDRKPPWKPTRVTVDFEQISYWEAMQRLSQQTGAQVRDRGGEIGFEDWRGRRPARPTPAYVSGPFLVIADDTFGAASPISDLTVCVDPGVRLLAYDPKPVILEARDAAGTPLLIDPHDGARPVAERFDSVFGDSVFTVYLPAPVSRKGRLRGSVRVLVAAEEKTYEFTLEPGGRRVDTELDGKPFQFTLEKEIAAANLWEVAFAAKAVPPPNAKVAAPNNKVARAARLAEMKALRAELNARTRVRTGVRQIELADADGKLFTSEGGSFFEQPPGCGPPAKVRMIGVSSTREVDVPFEFEFDAADNGAAGK